MWGDKVSWKKFLGKLFSYNVLLVLTVDLLATAGDITLSWTSPIYPKLYSNDTSANPLGRPITDDEDSWLGSLVTIGASIGPFPYSFIGGRFGRKIGLLCVAVPHIISYITMAFAKHIYLFYFGRLFGGLAMGGGYALLPMYIAEIAEDSNRGMMSVTLNIFWCIGNFIPYALGPFTSVMWFNIILACIPTFFFIIFIAIGTETPYYLIEKNKVDKAEKSLLKLRSAHQDGVEKELEMIRDHMQGDEQGHFSDILSRSELRKALMISVVLIVVQAASGYCAITFYLQPIFEEVGSDFPPEMSALLVGFVLLISSFISPFLVDRLGRRILTIWSCFGTFLSLLLLATFFFIQDYTTYNTDPVSWIPVFSIMFYIIFINFGLGPIPWTLCSELFPSNVKQIAASIQSSSCWITTFLVTFLFNDMNDVMGRCGTFWFFSAVCLCGFVFSIIYVPETKGKSFGEIQELLKFGPAGKPTCETGNIEKKLVELQSRLNNK